jgi:hypothetical protein
VMRVMDREGSRRRPLPASAAARSDVDAAGGGGERARGWTRRHDVGLASSRLPPAHGHKRPRPKLTGRGL